MEQTQADEFVTPASAADSHCAVVPQVNEGKVVAVGPGRRDKDGQLLPLGACPLTACVTRPPRWVLPRIQQTQVVRKLFPQRAVDRTAAATGLQSHPLPHLLLLTRPLMLHLCRRQGWGPGAAARLRRPKCQAPGHRVRLR